MLRHLRLFLSFAKNCWLGELEFRANLAMWVVVNLFWAITTLFLVNVIFDQAGTIAGWTKYEGLVLLLTQMLFISLLWISLLPNVTAFSGLIRKGDLDFVLLKPVSTLFWVTNRVVEFDTLPRVVIFPFLIAYFLRLGGFSPQFWEIAGYGVLLALGLLIFSNFLIILMTINFWFTNIFNLEGLIESIIDIGRFPAQAYTGLAKIVLVYMLPTIFIATIPTQFLLGESSLAVLFYAVLATAASYLVSRWLWRVALRRYSSASS